jgi:hypothetical protein
MECNLKSIYQINLLIKSVLQAVIILLFLQTATHASDDEKCHKKISISELPEYNNLKRLPSGCPKSDSFEPGILNASINDLKFNIPRKHLNSNQKASDGYYLNAKISLDYPDMISLHTKGWSTTNTINIFISSVIPHPKYGYDDIICDPDNEDWCYSRLMSSYKIFGAKYYHHSKRQYLSSLPKKNKIKHHSDLDLNSYKRKVVKSFSTTTYYRGEIDDPYYWLSCSDMRCESIFYFKNNRIRVQYNFPRSPLLEFHDNVREKIIKQLEDYISD